MSGGASDGEREEGERGKNRGLVWGTLNLRCLLALLMQMSSEQLAI